MLVTVGKSSTGNDLIGSLEAQGGHGDHVVRPLAQHWPDSFTQTPYIQSWLVAELPDEFKYEKQLHNQVPYFMESQIH